MTILIYGSGAVGLGLASCLIKAKQSVTLIARPETAMALSRFGLVRKGIFGNFKAPPKQFSVSTSLNDISESFDFILVTTKSFDSETAARDISRHKKILNKKTKIVLCQNGFGNTEIFAKYFPKKKIYNARIITGFIRPEPNVVTITVHADSVRMGSLFGAEISILKPLAHAISKGGLPSCVVKDVGKDIWAKMLYNCALNPLGALLDCPYGLLGDNLQIRNLMNKIIAEVFLVMKTAGFKTHWKTAKDYLKVFYSKSLPATDRHHSSMLQDIKANKKTEIESLNGIVIRLADQLKIPVPINRNVYRMIKCLEEGNFKKRCACSSLQNRCTPGKG